MNCKIFFIIAILLAGCANKVGDVSHDALSSVLFVDRNGTNETISGRERLLAFENIDFSAPQPYQKVIRAYEKDREGKIFARATTYHENGLVKQYIELVNGRAQGLYKEWHPNGTLRMEAHVIEGIGDLTDAARNTWVFDHESFVWNEEGIKVAEIYYQKGILQGVSKYYHENGVLARQVPYVKDQIHGSVEIYDRQGTLVGRINYLEGVKHGICHFEKGEDLPARDEIYQKGFLIEGKYYDFDNVLISEIKKGFGMRKVYKEGRLHSEHEYRNGIPEGEVRLFRDDGSLATMYHMHQGKKDGEERIYYPASTPQEMRDPRIMLSVNWREDKMQGTVRTWYENGRLESEKEMNDNKKHGMLVAWYREGSLMLVEEYDSDKLVSGKYLKKGEEDPLSRVVNGTGTATLFDADGDYLRKVEYRMGKVFHDQSD